ncbi:T9SS type A sorting domain-containing protein [Flavobacterium sp.]|uniref:T9SS type A sorting domain-containing protein n=1 Tax=Flavobacterium sp. TaxID=239 RepID=UPI0026051F95|nr:T9SS type A sorting domain-containing protein [Flavobacterium sp.]
MKTRLSLFIVLLTNLTLFAQPVWHEVLATSSGGRYDDVFFLNPNLGWAAGSGGYVYKTTDGGAHWNEQLFLNDAYIRNIEFLNENVGFLGILQGKLYKTINGGTTWTLVSDIIPPNSVNTAINNDVICGMDAIGTHTIYGCGAYFGPAYVIKSIDSGATWQYIDMSAYAESLVEIMFVDENTGFASGGNSNGGIILKTTDGGTSWTEIYHTGINGEYVWKLQRLFSKPDVLFGSVESISPLNGKLLKSVDGGQNWVSKEVPDTDIQAVGFISETHGWMGGHHTGFLETFDSGETWTNTGFGGSLNRIQVFNENLVYCSGTEIYKFSDENLGTQNFNPNTERERLEVTIAPNPVENQLEFSVNFKTDDHIILRLFDVNGKMLQEFKREVISAAAKKNYSFPFPYPAGTYYLNLHNDTGGQSEKFIKK